MKLTFEAEELEEMGFTIDMSEILEVENEYAQIGALIGVAEDVEFMDI